MIVNDRLQVFIIVILCIFSLQIVNIEAHCGGFSRKVLKSDEIYSFGSQTAAGYDANMYCEWFIDTESSNSENINEVKSNLWIEFDYIETLCLTDTISIFNSNETLVAKISGHYRGGRSDPYIAPPIISSLGPTARILWTSGETTGHNYIGFSAKAYESKCPFKCSQNGRCNEENGQCECDDGFIGLDCSVSVINDSDCGTPEDGGGYYDEATGHCFCDEGWRGSKCSIATTNTNEDSSTYVDAWSKIGPSPIQSPEGVEISEDPLDSSLMSEKLSSQNFDQDQLVWPNQRAGHSFTQCGISKESGAPLFWSFGGYTVESEDLSDFFALDTGTWKWIDFTGLNNTATDNIIHNNGTNNNNNNNGTDINNNNNNNNNNNSTSPPNPPSFSRRSLLQSTTTNSTINSPSARRYSLLLCSESTSTLYLVGGETAERELFGDFWAFYIDQGYWERLKPTGLGLDYKRSMISGVFINEIEILLYGGYAGPVATRTSPSSATSAVHTFNTVTKELQLHQTSGPAGPQGEDQGWIAYIPEPAGRAQDPVVFIGGGTNNVFGSGTYFLHLNSWAWELNSVGSVDVGLSFVTSSASKDYLFFFSGQDSTSPRHCTSESIHVFSYSTLRWAMIDIPLSSTNPAADLIMPKFRYSGGAAFLKPNSAIESLAYPFSNSTLDFGDSDEGLLLFGGAADRLLNDLWYWPVPTCSAQKLKKSCIEFSLAHCSWCAESMICFDASQMDASVAGCNETAEEIVISDIEPFDPCKNGGYCSDCLIWSECVWCDSQEENVRSRCVGEREVCGEASLALVDSCQPVCDKYTNSSSCDGCIADPSCGWCESGVDTSISEGVCYWATSGNGKDNDECAFYSETSCPRLCSEISADDCDECIENPYPPCVHCADTRAEMVGLGLDPVIAANYSSGCQDKAKAELGGVEDVCFRYTGNGEVDECPLTCSEIRDCEECQASDYGCGWCGEFISGKCVEIDAAEFVRSGQKIPQESCTVGGAETGVVPANFYNDTCPPKPCAVIEDCGECLNHEPFECGWCALSWSCMDIELIPGPSGYDGYDNSDDDDDDEVRWCRGDGEWLVPGTRSTQCPSSFVLQPARQRRAIIENDEALTLYFEIDSALVQTISVNVNPIYGNAETYMAVDWVPTDRHYIWKASSTIGRPLTISQSNTYFKKPAKYFVSIYATDNTRTEITISLSIDQHEIDTTAYTWPRMIALVIVLTTCTSAYVVWVLVTENDKTYRTIFRPRRQTNSSGLEGHFSAVVEFDEMEIDEVETELEIDETGLLSRRAIRPTQLDIIDEKSTKVTQLKNYDEMKLEEPNEISPIINSPPISPIARSVGNRVTEEVFASLLGNNYE